MPMVWAPHDRRAFARGDMTSSPEKISIDAIVSKDLGILVDFSAGLTSFLFN